MMTIDEFEEAMDQIAEELPDGNRLVRFSYEGIFLEVLDRLGKMPLPPYIKEELQDQERYAVGNSIHISNLFAVLLF